MHIISNLLVQIRTDTMPAYNQKFTKANVGTTVSLVQDLALVLIAM